MGTTESIQSTELSGIAGLTNQLTHHRQSPNIARLIRSENSSKMEYEFPISEVPTSSSSYHHHYHQSSGTNNHSIITRNNNRQDQSSLYYASSSNFPQISHSGRILRNYDSMPRSKIHSNQTSNLWLSLTSCFGCHMRGSKSSSNLLRDKVHTIRIVRASDDLTPAIFDSHYNIITLEQLRECDHNASGNIDSLRNDLSNSLPPENPTINIPAQNGNASITKSAQSSSLSKNDNNSHRMRKKKEKQMACTTHSCETTFSDDDDDNDDEGEGYGRT